MQAQLMVRPFRAEDYDSALSLWSATEGVEVSEGDEPLGIAGYLNRNPDLSRVAEMDGRLIGAVLCGHDGRRGLIYHLAVAVEARGLGLGKKLVEECVRGLRGHGIRRVLILVEKDNLGGRDFWGRQGFEELSGATAMGLTLC